MERISMIDKEAFQIGVELARLEKLLEEYFTEDSLVMYHFHAFGVELLKAARRETGD